MGEGGILLGMPKSTPMDRIREEISPDLEELSRLFRALADPVRLHILLLLAQGERNVTSLCKAIGLAQPTVSHHLGLLRGAALAEGRRAGKSIIYSAGHRVRIDGPTLIEFRGSDESTVQIRLPSGTPSRPK